MGEEVYLCCMTCKKRLWLGKHASVNKYGSLGITQALKTYVQTLKFIEEMVHTRFVIYDELESFLNEHGDTEHHWLEIVGDESDDWMKVSKFEEVKQRA